MPGRLLYRSDQENPGRCACQCDGCQDRESPVKAPGPVQDESGDCRSHNPCQIAEEILETCPSPRGLGARERLCDCPDIRTANAEKDHTQHEHRYANDWPADGRQREENPGKC